jgi:predicted cupin superfamily sugar epimerase
VRFKSADEAISALGLVHLDGEGGYFSTSHRDEFGNAIYFLMSPGEFSAWHKLSERETWVYLDGAPVEIFTRTDSSTTTHTTLAREDSEMLLSIEPQTWMAARTTGDFSLVLCFLAPPFSAMTLLSRESFNQWQKIEPGIPELIHG